MGDEAEPAQILGEREYQRLMQAAGHSTYPCRDRAILHLFWHFGTTVRQVVGLEIGGINFLTGRLVWPDGREGSAAPEALHALTTYVSLERDPRCPKLFSGRHGRPMCPLDVDRLFRRLAAQSGVPVDPLALRRAALARLLRAQPLRALGLLRGPGSLGGPREAIDGLAAQ